MLRHYGVKGMHWGIRRYQNPDGTLTAAGREQRRIRDKARRRIVESRKTEAEADSIFQSLSDREKFLLTMREGEDLNKPWVRESAHAAQIAKRIVSKYGDLPVSFIEIYNDPGTSHGEIAIATRGGDKYRGKGIASTNVRAALDWYDRYGNRTIKDLYWEAANSNIASLKLAQKYGFEKIGKEYYPDNIPYHPEWSVYKYKGRKKK